jgi:hypothetical protein
MSNSPADAKPTQLDLRTKAALAGARQALSTQATAAGAYEMRPERRAKRVAVRHYELIAAFTAYLEYELYWRQTNVEESDPRGQPPGWSDATWEEYIGKDGKGGQAEMLSTIRPDHRRALVIAVEEGILTIDKIKHSISPR